jgi:hypothetical protein
MAATIPANRSALVRRGQRLEYFTIGYNSLEGLLSIVAGLIAGSVSLVGFGLDSAIEVASGTALLWRLHHDLNPTRREQVERTVLRIVGGCFIALASYIAYKCGSTLVRHEAPDPNHPHWDFHVHRASQEAIEAGFRAERHAEKALEFASFEEALPYFLKEVNVEEQDVETHFPGNGKQMDLASRWTFNDRVFGEIEAGLQRPHRFP